MQNEIIVAGFGGQGVLFGGQLLAYTAMDHDLHVTWIPAYGPEMRGGTANCTVIVSDEEIGSPMVREPKAVIAMNMPSQDKYEPLIKSGGVLVVNSSIVDHLATREDITIHNIPANDLAEQVGNPRSTNMILLGALLSELPIFPLEAIIESLHGHTPDRNKRFIPSNIEALTLGYNYKQ